MAKYLFTPEMDNEILYTYSINTDSKPRLLNLAKKFNMPRWAIYQQKKPWTDKEIKLLEKNAKYTPQTIKKRLEKAGFNRSAASIVLKRKRMRLLSNLDGMSAALCAEFLGLDLHRVLNYVGQGLLKVEVIRRDREGKVNYHIREKNVRKFIINNPDMIDLRKVEKYYFIELLANGVVH
jgi:hypothetical protein